MNLFLNTFALLLVIATLLPLSRSRQWYIRAMDFPRLQILFMCIAWLIVAGSGDTSDNSFIVISSISVAIVAIYQVFWMMPNTQLFPVEMQGCLGNNYHSKAAITLLSSNVLMHNRNAEALLSLVSTHQPDVLITLESDHWWQKQLDTLKGYPHKVACPLDNLYGMHVYSRLPLAETSIDYLVEQDKPSMHMNVQLANNQWIRLHVVHPAPPAPTENNESIERDVELLVIAKHVAEHAGPVIVAGDLNDVSWSATTRLFREISALKDPRIGRGMFNTFNARHWFIRWPLDHMFASTHFQLINMQRLQDIGSDHFPILATFALTKSGEADETPMQSITDEDLLEHIEQTDTAKQASEPGQ